MENTFMYAVMKTGGKQYKVTPGNTLKIEKIEADVGASVDFDNVLMVAQGEDIRVGAPHVEGGKIVATVLNQGRGKKVKILKFKRRKHHLKRMGHRQAFTEVVITSIMAEGIEETWQPPPIWQPPVETVDTTPETDEVQEPTVDDTAAEKPKIDVTPASVDDPTNEVTPPDSQKK